MNNQLRWESPKYTKRQINNAGDMLREANVSQVKMSKQLEVVDNWRASHAYPLHVLYIYLRNMAPTEDNVLVVERLKRLESIINKLRREDEMQLYRMQDIGGCRMVVPSLDDVIKYSDKIKKSRVRHELIRQYDYIQQPKPSGYRSLHLVYRYRTDTPEKEIYNQYPMLIELQFRTHLQHIWATAVETIGLFMHEPLKAGQGEDKILRFFALVSSLFAIEEGCNLVPGTPTDEQELIKEIKTIDTQHHVLEMLQAIRSVIKSGSGDTAEEKKGYYLLILDYEKREVRINFFKPTQLEKATKAYEYLEKVYADQPYDIVLVRAASYDIVRAAYPNYFLDIGEFIASVNKYLE